MKCYLLDDLPLSHHKSNENGAQWPENDKGRMGFPSPACNTWSTAKFFSKSKEDEILFILWDFKQANMQSESAAESWSFSSVNEILCSWRYPTQAD